jgi:hypothetical protein
LLRFVWVFEGGVGGQIRFFLETPGLWTKI